MVGVWVGAWVGGWTVLVIRYIGRLIDMWVGPWLGVKTGRATKHSLPDTCHCDTHITSNHTSQVRLPNFVR